MRFDTALGATHGSRRFGNVHFLPVTHEEGFPLTSGQLLDLDFNFLENLATFHGGLGAFVAFRAFHHLQSFQHVEFAIIARRFEVAQVGE